MAFSNDVFAYGNVDGLVGLFTATKLVVGSNDFQDLIRLAVIIGFLVVSIAALSPKNWAKGWKWLLQVAVISGIAFVPKSNVTIIDRLGIQPAQVVADVPWGLAVLWSIKSNVGDRITDLMEQGFQVIPTDAAMPSDLSYREHGMMFGNKLMAGHMTSRFRSADVEADTTNYIKNCFIPVIGRLVTEDQVLSAGTDLWGLMGNTNVALFTSYHKDLVPSGTAVEVDDCKTVYAALTPKVNADAVKQIAKLAPSFYPAMTVAAAQAAYGNGLVSAMVKAKLASSAETANNLILTSALRNSFGAANMSNMVVSGDNTAMLQAYSQAQATASMNASFQAEGTYAEQAMPIMRNITDGLLIGIFPLVIVLLLMSEGMMAKKIIVGYLLTAVWVELWPPMFAVVNFMGTTSSARDLAAASAYAGGLSLENSGGVYGGVISGTAMIGKYLNMVPFLAGALLFGMDRMISGGGMTKAPVDSAAQSAGEAAKGNANGGNISMDKRSMSTEESSAYMRKNEYTNGVVYKDALNGEFRADVRTGTNPNAVDITRNMAQKWSDQSLNSAAAGTALTSNYERSVNAAYSDVLATAKGSSLQQTLVNGVAVQEMNSAGVGKSEVTQTTKQIAEKLGISNDTAVSLGIEAAVQAGINGGAAGAVLRTAGLNIQGKLAAAGKTVSAETITNALESGVTNLKQTGLQRKMDVVQSYMQGEDFKTARSSNKDATQRVDRSLSEAVGSRDGANAKFEEAKRYQSMAEKAMAISKNWKTNYAADLNYFLKEEGVTPGSSSYDFKKAEAATLRFIESGMLFKDDNDKPFLSAFGGQGPTSVAAMPGGGSAYAPGENGASPLLDDFEAARGKLPKQVPSRVANDAQVRQESAQQGARVSARQSASGLRPTDQVSAPGLKARAQEAETRSRAEIEAEGVVVRQNKEAAQSKMDVKQGDASPFHMRDNATLAEQTPTNFGMGSGASKLIPKLMDSVSGMTSPEKPSAPPTPSGGASLIPGPTESQRQAAAEASKLQQDQKRK